MMPHKTLCQRLGLEITPEVDAEIRLAMGSKPGVKLAPAALGDEEH